MSLLTPALIKRFQEVGEQIHTNQPLILAKFFAPWNGWEWYISEYHSQADVYYGYVVMEGQGKWCYFRIPEEQGFNAFQIQRDPTFAEVFFDRMK